MLEVVPKRRGKFPGKGEDSNALTRLRKIIHWPTLHVRYFYRSLTYGVSPKTTVSSIKAKIAKDLEIPETEQVILAPGGMLLSDSELVYKYSEVMSMVFLCPSMSPKGELIGVIICCHLVAFQNTVGVYLLMPNESFITNFPMPTSLSTFLKENDVVHEWKKSRPAVQKLFADTIGFLQTDIMRVETLAGCCRALL